MRRLTRAILMAAAGILSSEANDAYAQVLGTFRWQFAPYCNVVTVRVEQKGAVYEFSGTDDGCDGAAPASTVNGSAHLNASGSAGGSLTVVRPDGFVVTNAVILSPATLAGTWRDDWGNSGTLVFNPASPAAGRLGRSACAVSTPSSTLRPPRAASATRRLRSPARWPPGSRARPFTS